MEKRYLITLFIALATSTLLQASNGSSFGAGFGGGLLGGMVGGAMTQPRRSHTEVVTVQQPAPQRYNDDIDDSATVRRLRKDNRDLQGEIADLEDENYKIKRENNRLKKDIERLQERLNKPIKSQDASLIKTNRVATAA